MALADPSAVFAQEALRHDFDLRFTNLDEVSLFPKCGQALATQRLLDSTYASANSLALMHICYFFPILLGQSERNLEVSLYSNIISRRLRGDDVRVSSLPLE